MTSTFFCIDVIGKGKNVFIVRIVVLKGYFHDDAIFFTRNIDGIAMEDPEALDKLSQGTRPRRKKKKRR